MSKALTKTDFHFPGQKSVYQKSTMAISMTKSL